MYISSVFTMDNEMCVRDAIESSTSLVQDRMRLEYQNCRYGNIYKKIYRGKSFWVMIEVPARYNLAGVFQYENWDDVDDPDCHNSHFYSIPVFDGDMIEYYSGCPAGRASIKIFNPRGDEITKSRMNRVE